MRNDGHGCETIARQPRVQDKDGPNKRGHVDRRSVSLPLANDGPASSRPADGQPPTGTKRAGRAHAEPDPANDAQAAGELALMVVAGFMAKRQSALIQTTRGSPDICLARQIAIYLMHTTMSRSYREVARFFRRDRTTVYHACRQIEDRRDDPAFDRRIEAMEELLFAIRHFADTAVKERAGSDG